MTTSMTDALAAALAFQRRGWRPIPLDHPSLPRCTGPKTESHDPRTCEKRGKHPAGKWGTIAAHDPSEKWLASVAMFGGEARNVGIAVKLSGLIVLDEDQLDALTLLAAALGKTLPCTYRVRTSRGWHWYFRAPAGIEIGNRTKGTPLAEYGIDVRGGKGDGGYVVAAGSMHASGHVYVAEDAAAEVAPLPEWLVAMLATEDDEPVPGRERVAERPGGRLAPDDVRIDTLDRFRADYRRSLDGCRHQGGPWREELYKAALDGWRLVELDELDVDTLKADLNERCREVWGADLDARDRRIWRVEAREAAQRSPWELRGELGGFKIEKDTYGTRTDSSTDSKDAQVEAAAERWADVERRAYSMEVDEDARRLVARRKRAGRESIRDGLIDVRKLDEIPPPEWLVSGLIPKAAIGFLAGKFGSYKSFAAVSLACTMAVGKAWQGRDEWAVEAPIRNLYVAAEGASGIAQRIRAWEHKHGEIDAGQLAVYPRPIRLNDPEEVAELEAVIVEHGFGHVFVDTYHRSAPGTEENSSTEFGAVFESAARLRDAHGTTFTFLDHTGHAGGRTRGTSAKEDDADFVLLLDLDGEGRGSDVQRTLYVRKLKDAPVDGMWPVALRDVPGTGSAYLVVLDASTDGGEELFREDRRRWWEAEIDLPEKVAGLKGRGSTVAMDVYRVLDYVGGYSGLTKAEIIAALKERPGKAPDRSAVHRALALMADEGLTKPGETGSKLVVAEGLK